MITKHINNLGKLVEYLINNTNINVNIKDLKDRSPFWHASLLANEKIIDLFLKNEKLNMNSENFSNFLFFSLNNKSEKSFELHLNKVKDKINIKSLKNNKNQYLIHIAAREDLGKSIDIMIKEGADISKLDLEGIGVEKSFYNNFVSHFSRF